MAAELGFVIVTHGRIGEELLRVADHIMGRKLGTIRVVAVPFMSETTAAFASGPAPYENRLRWLLAEIEKSVEAVDSGAGVIILTDIVGGTAFNASRQLLETGKGTVIAGVNLPMLLKIPSIRSLGLDEAAAELVSRSRQAIECRQPPCPAPPGAAPSCCK
jgi:mannose PTS system EIIA component